MQVGTNGRIAAQSTDTKKQGQDASDEFIPYSPFPTEGLRRLIQQSQVSQAISIFFFFFFFSFNFKKINF